MFKVKDYVVYSSTGVCQILDIKREKDINNHEVEYYILQPVYSNNMTVRTPVDNQKVVMREIITKDDVSSLIASMPDKETVWTEDYRRRSVEFKEVLKAGECSDLVKIIKTLYLEKQKKSSLGKKLMKSDEEILKVAEKRLHEEFAIALNISLDEVVPYIQNHIS